MLYTDCLTDVASDIISRTVFLFFFYVNKIFQFLSEANFIPIQEAR